MRKLLIAFAIISSLYGICITNAIAKENTFSSVTIYYFGWDVLTRVALKPETVRESSNVIISINDSHRADVFFKWLNTGEMKIVDGGPSPENTRLVIDFVSTNGSVLTYYASQFNLVSGDSSLKRPIDDNFRNRFRFGEVAFSEH